MEKEFLYACRSGDRPTVMWLAQKISNIDYMGDYGYTGLMESLRHAHDKIAKFLINNGADVNIQANNEIGETPLMDAARFGTKDIVELLINKGADTTFKDKKGNTAFNHAYNYAFVFHEMETRMPILILLRPDIINHQDPIGNTELMKCCNVKSESAILSLYEAGANFHLENNAGDSAFKILKRKHKLPERLQALKEKLILDQLICNDEHNDLSL